MPPPIDETQVRHIAKLARLQLSDAEILQFADKLAQIVAFVGQLSLVPTDGVQPLAHPWPGGDVLRPDFPAAPLTLEEALANAPQHINSHFKVPAVLDPAGGP